MMNVTQKQLNCKKRCGPMQKCQDEVVKHRWWPRNGCDGRSVAKIYNDNSGQFVLPYPIGISIQDEKAVKYRWSGGQEMAVMVGQWQKF